MAQTTTLDDLTLVRYVSQDFKTYVDEITNFLKTYYPDEYNDYVDSSLGMAMIHMVAYANAGLAFYMNRRTTDLYMPTSVSPTSISLIARMLNYTIEAASVASVDLTVTLKSGPYAFPIIITKPFKFQGPNGLIYEYRDEESLIFNPGDLTKTITAYEGETKEASFVSDGKENQIFKLVGIDAGKFLIGATLDVYVGGELWTEKNQIPYEIGNFYEVNYISDPPTIKFGDGIAGTVPENGKDIRVTYVVGSGLAGRVGSGTITSVVNELVIRNENIPLTITNAAPSSGGDDYEDLRKVKALAPEFFQSQDRAITKRDYDAIANTYPGVAKADAHIIRTMDDDITVNNYLNDINDAVSGCSGSVPEDVASLTAGLKTYLNETMTDTCAANIVQVAMLSKDINNQYTTPSSGLLENLRAHLQDRADAVHVVKTVSGGSLIVSVNMAVRIRIGQNAVESEVLQRAMDALLKYDAQPYGALVLREFGKSLYKWEVNKAIRDAQLSDTDIDYADIYITSPIGKLDGAGNLIIEVNEVIQAGTVTVDKIVL